MSPSKSSIGVPVYDNSTVWEWPDVVAGVGSSETPAIIHPDNGTCELAV